MYWYDEIMHLDFESSSLCNASCAICNRRYAGGSKADGMIETYVTLKQFKEWFPVEFIKNLVGMSMCGNYGDSMTNPELLDILRYARNLNTNLIITMNTNASGRTPQFWTELSEIIGTAGHLTFSVDGLKDTNWIYRKGTHWDKIMMAMENYKKGPGSSRWEFLVFKHNQHQVEEARQLSKDIGIDSFHVKEAFGFNEDAMSGEHRSYFVVFGENDKHLYDIEAKTNTPFDHEKFLNTYKNLNKKLGDGFLRQPFRSAGGPLNEWEKKLGKTCIECQVIKPKSIFVSSEGLVFPCCMTAGKLYAPDTDDSIQLKKFIADIGKDNINLNHNSLQDIIDGDVFQVSWPDNWKDNNILNKRLRVCSMFCGKETNSNWKKVQESMATEN